MITRTKRLLVRTPEGISFPLAIASPLSRFLALTVDQFAIAVISSVMATVVGLLGLIHWDFAFASSMVLSFLVSFVYRIGLEWRWEGQTLGKKLLRVQVMDVQGLRLQFSQIVIRNLLRPVDALPVFYLLGGMACFFSMRGQRLGDLAANTIVVYHPRTAEPDLSQVLPGKFNSFREHPHLVARLRQDTTPAEAGTALQAILRRDSLDPEARPGLFHAIRETLEGKVRFPADVTDGISDEQYVRNAVDVLMQ